MTTTLYLVRHGETDWNRARRIQGSTDVPLNDVGRQQAAGAADLLSRRRVDAVVASPLGRAVETGSIIATRLGLAAPSTDSGLVERSYGEAEGLTDVEIAERFADGGVPGRESRASVLRRVRAALTGIAVAHRDQAVVVATHGAVIRSVIADVAPGRLDVTEPIRNGSIHSFFWSDDPADAALIRFDDPIEDESEAGAGESFDAQNPLDRLA